MTETQAMSETAGAPASPVEKDGGDAASATGRAAVVGRATVPADQSEPTPARSATGGDESAGSNAAAATTTTGTFTRPAGMPVPDSEPTGAIATRSRPCRAVASTAA